MRVVPVVSFIWAFVFASASFAGDAQDCKQALSLVIVDGYSSGRLIAPHPLLKSWGVTPIHIHSNGAPMGYQADTFYPKNFALDVPYAGDYPGLLELLRRLRPSAIIPGAESGVLLADQLSADLQSDLGVPSNGVLLARRDKYLMGEQLRAHGVPTKLALRAHSIEETLAWIRSHHLLPGKVVLKPPMSGGTDGLHFATTEEEIRSAFSKLYRKPNQMEQLNEFVLVEEYLPGIEYVVNTTSRDGITKVDDIWQYVKRERKGRGVIYDYDILLPFEGEIQRQLVEYDLQVLKALGIQNGWGHAEIKFPEKGPRLIEIGARMMGSGQPRLAHAAIGHSQVESGILAYLKPEAFFQLPRGYVLQKHAMMVSLAAEEGGRALTLAAEPEILKLPGYFSHKFMIKEGELAPRTDDMFTELGQIELVHADPEVLKRSYETIRQWEREGRFLGPKTTDQNNSKDN